MSTVDEVKKIAKSLGLLNNEEKLKPLDSLGMIDLVIGLEKANGVEIPAAGLREESFVSLESIAELIDQYSKK